MDAIMMILFLNTIMWYVIDNLKENIWGNKAYSRYITIAASALGAFALSFGYGLDIVYALSITNTTSILGQIITALAMMGGSAVVSELVEMLRNNTQE
jgi:hypothetical protein